MTRTRSTRIHLALALVVVLALAACQPPVPSRRTWASIDRDLAAMGPHVSFLAARIAPDGRCRPVHETRPSTARPAASQFKLFVLGALVNEIKAGRLSWDRTMTVQSAVQSLGNGPGSLQFVPPGTVVTVEEAATKMISISDNTATDMLIGLLGRDVVEAQVRRWSSSPSANEPFLTTRQMFLLHYVTGLGDLYLATPRDQRDAFLASSVDPWPLGAIASGYSPDPRFIDQIEWFFSPNDVCRAFSGLQALSKEPSLAPLSTILSLQVAGIGLDPPRWRTVWYKGGSEPGVLTLGWLARNRRGETFVVEAMVSNPDAVLSDDSITDLVALGREAFALLDP